LLWPIIAQHEGMVIEIGGDVLMAAFFDPHAGVQSARLPCNAPCGTTLRAPRWRSVYGIRDIRDVL
jgi:hypothetical protein